MHPGAKYRGEIRRVLYLAFPDDDRPPAQSLQRGAGCRVALHVATQLRDPVFGPGLRDPGAPTAGVLMPKASVDEQGDAMLRKHKVWPPRQIAAVQPEAQAEGMGRPPHRKLRPRVAPLDPGHDPRAFLLGYSVCHASALYPAASL